MPLANKKTVFQAEDLELVFNRLFLDKENTKLVSGGLEPLYLPASVEIPFNQIIFTQDYFASALHEIAHWCLAGSARRKLVDYGYWYAPDGRDTSLQKAFEKVEVKPQALESIFHKSCGHTFILSTDNLNNENLAPEAFKQAVLQQEQQFQQDAMPERAALFIHALQAFYNN